MSMPTHKIKFSLSDENIEVSHFICTLDCRTNKLFIQSFYDEVMRRHGPV